MAALDRFHCIYNFLIICPYGRTLYSAFSTHNSMHSGSQDQRLERSSCKVKGQSILDEVQQKLSACGHVSVVTMATSP